MTFRARCGYPVCSWQSDPEPSTEPALARLKIHLAYASHASPVNPAEAREPEPIVESVE